MAGALQVATVELHHVKCTEIATEICNKFMEGWGGALQLAVVELRHVKCTEILPSPHEGRAGVGVVGTVKANATLSFCSPRRLIYMSRYFRQFCYTQTL